MCFRISKIIAFSLHFSKCERQNHFLQFTRFPYNLKSCYYLPGTVGTAFSSRVSHKSVFFLFVSYFWRVVYKRKSVSNYGTWDKTLFSSRNAVPTVPMTKCGMVTKTPIHHILTPLYLAPKYTK